MKTETETLLLDKLKQVTEAAAGWQDECHGQVTDPVILEAREFIAEMEAGK